MGLRLSINNLTPSEIKNFIMNFGLFNEALLSKKQKLNQNNQKVLIGQLIRLLNERGVDSQAVSERFWISKPHNLKQIKVYKIEKSSSR